MNSKTISWQQLAVFVVCLAAAFAAHKFLGLDAGMAAGVVTSIIAFMMGRGQDPPPSDPPASGKGPGLKAIGFTAAALALCLSGCAEFQRDVKFVLDAGQVACVIANATSDDATVMQVCGIADVLIPDLKVILAAQRASLAKAKKEAACHQ